MSDTFAAAGLQYYVYHAQPDPCSLQSTCRNWCPSALAACGSVVLTTAVIELELELHEH